MPMPGFWAEMTLYRQNDRYESLARKNTRSSQAEVLPQIDIRSWCSLHGCDWICTPSEGGIRSYDCHCECSTSILYLVQL